MPEPRITHRSTPKPPTLRASDDGTPGRFLEGYAAKFGVTSSVICDGDVTDEDGDPIPYIEVIDPGAFDRTLREGRDVLAVYEHDLKSPLGRTSAGTLKLWTDRTGLAFKNEIPETRAGQDARVSVGRGDIRECSFGFLTPKGGDRVEVRSGLPALRTLLDVDLVEITVGTVFPAYPDTEVALRARTERRREGPTRDVRSWIRRERERLGLSDF